MDQIEPERRPPFGEHTRVFARGEETHRRLLAAALEAFAELGYHATSVESIARRAECSRPAFYQYFAGKEDLFRRVADRLGGELMDLTAQLSSVGRDDRGHRVLRAWLRDLVSLHDRYAPIFRTFEVPVRRDDRMAVAAQGVMQRSGAIFASAFRGEAPTPAGTEEFAALVLYTLTRACGLRLERRPALETDRLVAGLADWAHRCFYGPIPGVNVTAASGPRCVSRRRIEPLHASLPEPVAPDSARGRRSRDRLLGAATGVFEELGYAPSRVDDIARAAGLSHGTFYRYFASKEAIFAELARPALEDMSMLLSELPEPVAGFGSWARRWYQTYAVHGGHFFWWPEPSASIASGERGDAGAELARRVFGHVMSMLIPALSVRGYGDVELDSLVLLAHVEHGPFMARIYPEFPASEAIAATTVILERAFFGPLESDVLVRSAREPGSTRKPRRSR